MVRYNVFDAWPSWVEKSHWVIDRHGYHALGVDRLGVVEKAGIVPYEYGAFRDEGGSLTDRQLSLKIKGH